MKVQIGCRLGDELDRLKVIFCRNLPNSHTRKQLLGRRSRECNARRTDRGPIIYCFSSEEEVTSPSKKVNYFQLSFCSLAWPVDLSSRKGGKKGEEAVAGRTACHVCPSGGGHRGAVDVLARGTRREILRRNTTSSSLLKFAPRLRPRRLLRSLCRLSFSSP